MLKPPSDHGPVPDDSDRPVGDLVQELIEDGKAYAQAELDHVKAIAASKANALKLPAILFAVVFLFALAAFVALVVGIANGLATLIGPLAGGIATCLIFAAIAGGLGWYGAKRLREDF